MGCHCIEISRCFIGKDVKPIEVMCWADTQVHPIDAEDSAVGLVKYANGAVGQFEVILSSPEPLVATGITPPPRPGFGTRVAPRKGKFAAANPKPRNAGAFGIDIPPAAEVRLQ